MGFAQDFESSHGSFPILSGTVEEIEVLWIPWKNEDDNEIYWDSFIIEHGRPAGRWNIIPWLKLEHIPLAVPSNLPEIPDSVDEFLDRMTTIKQESIQVRLEVWADDDVYKVDLTGKSFTERREFIRTKELVRFLRTPVWSGTGYRSRSKRKALTWDHRVDITYREKLSFLIPLVHRSRFYPDWYQYPRSSRELFRTARGPELTMVIKRDGDRCSIELRNLPATSTLNWIENEVFTKSHLVLLAECEEFFDTKSGISYPVKLDVSEIMDMTLRGIDEHSRLSQSFEVEKENLHLELISKQDDPEHKEEYVEEKQRDDEQAQIYKECTFYYFGIEIKYDMRGATKIEVILDSEVGNLVVVTVIKDVQGYVSGTRSYGGIDPDEVKYEVTDSLEQYDLEEGELEKIIMVVKEDLEERDIRFREPK
ncbi:MAG: hypothetical protein ACW98Y_20545 [Candidatus Thorarchaeota archaeon]